MKFIKFIKNFFRAELATSLIKQNFFIKNIEENQKYNLGPKNINKNFYIIRRKFSPSGLFSNLTFVLNNLLYAKKKNYIPFIDMQNFPTIYNEKKEISGTLNSWEYYFHQVTNYKLKDIYRSKNVFFSKDIFKKNFSKDLFYLSKNKIINQIKKKIIKIKEKHLKEAKKKIRLFFSKKKILGVLIRGTTQKVAANHQLPINCAELIVVIKKILNKEKCERIFLVTEDLEYFNLLKNKFKDIIIFNKSNKFEARFFSIHSINEKKINNFRYCLGKEILIDMLMLANCDILLSSDSNVGGAAVFFKKKIKKLYLIESEKNSNNIFFARWLWYCKNYFPYLFGSIKYKIKKFNYNYK